MFDSQTISLESGVYNVMAKANGFLLIGNSNGDLAVVEPTTGKTLQRFNDHKGSITDIYAVSVIFLIAISLCIARIRIEF